MQILQNIKSHNQIQLLQIVTSFKYYNKKISKKNPALSIMYN
jgi:hypothetical protein